MPDDYIVTLLTTSSRCHGKRKKRQKKSEQARKKPCSVCCHCCHRCMPLLGNRTANRHRHLSHFVKGKGEQQVEASSASSGQFIVKKAREARKTSDKNCNMHIMAKSRGQTLTWRAPLHTTLNADPSSKRRLPLPAQPFADLLRLWAPSRVGNFLSLLHHFGLFFCSTFHLNTKICTSEATTASPRSALQTTMATRKSPQSRPDPAKPGPFVRFTVHKNQCPFD